VAVFVLAVLFSAAMFLIRHEATRSRRPRTATPAAGVPLAQEAR
jgi:hypothetical protein